ncbi:phage tail protein [Pseudomonas sp. CCI3.2]|uniref:phage tail protein n=1 Tax=unclassified Pseudomonas TaxID=196821 RepID=UPI002B2274E7|nr:MULTISPECIES: phage tail protein [unclassified Pseudomonas]MEB0078011.1 phage tail protein [Pseudomonas sp. MH10out]MEB0104018.1 phage tail protein [Pseudomonas sp. CCI3.2]
MPIYQAGALNTAALTAPDLYIQVVQPKTRYINGVATDILGIVGVASWGAVNSPMLIGSPGDAALKIGAQQVRKYDLATAVAVSIGLGASNIRAVRVTDGTDTAATSTLKDTAAAIGATLTAFYTGTLGNSLSAVLSTGTANSSWKLVVSLPGVSPEVFDNITGTAGALWANIVNAVNNGQSGIRGASQLVIATVGVSVLAPVVTTQTIAFTAGTDGTTTLTDAVLVGVDGSGATRKGIYSLRGTGAQVANLVEVTDSTQWPAMLTYGLSEGCYVITQGPAGASYATVSASLNTAGCDSYALKVMVGDWVYWYDQVNSQQRMLCPSTFSAAKIAALAPHQSPLNKPLTNVVTTQRNLAQQPYSLAEIGAINTARLDVITNPCPGGSYFGHRSGLNCASNPTVNGDNYTRMTNFLSLTLAASFGYVVGQLQTVDLRRTTKSTISSFLQILVDQAMIGDPNGGPAFSVQIDATNNPDSRVALGYMQADVQVKYLSVVRYFLINLEAGQSVTVVVSAAPR